MAHLVSISVIRPDLIEHLRTALPELDDEQRSAVIDKCATIVEPAKVVVNEPPLIHMLTIDSLRRSGSSIKPGNLTLNLEKALVDLVESGLMVAGGFASFYLVPFAALLILHKFKTSLKIELKEVHAETLIAMWEHRDHASNSIRADGAFMHFNNARKRRNMPLLVRADFDLLLDALEDLGCIAPSKEDIRSWKLVEQVRFTYGQ